MSTEKEQFVYDLTEITPAALDILIEGVGLKLVSLQEEIEKARNVLDVLLEIRDQPVENGEVEEKEICPFYPDDDYLPEAEMEWNKRLHLKHKIILALKELGIAVSATGVAAFICEKEGKVFTPLFKKQVLKKLKEVAAEGKDIIKYKNSTYSILKKKK